jgi:malonate transporter MadL subunit
MILLIAARLWIARRGLLDEGVVFGVGFWGSLYIPIVVAMAANQNVLAAIRSGPMVAIAAIGAVLLCFAVVALMGRLAGPTETMDEIEARQRAEQAVLGEAP